MINESSNLSHEIIYGEKYQCIFINNYILINVSSNNNKCVLEVCAFNEKNEIYPKYLLIYDKASDFNRHINYYINTIGLNIFLEGMSFNNENFIKLYIDDVEEIAILFDLLNVNKNQKISAYKENIPISYNNQNINNNQIQISSSNQIIKNNFNFNSQQNFSCLNNQNKYQNNFINQNYFHNNNKNKNPNKNIDFNNREPIQSTKITSIDEEFIYPPKIGLQNVGATCYMNATLQCFCQIKKFVNFFKYHDKIHDIINKINNRDENLTYSFKYLIENLWPSKNNRYFLPKYNFEISNNKYFAPYKFKQKISRMNPLFSGVAANDSKDLVNFIIMALHDELNKAPKKPNSDINRFEINQSNEMDILKNFIKCFGNENQSIISDIFYGVNKTGTQCTGCKVVKYNFQAYFFLIFPLEEVRKNKIMQCQNQLMLMNQNMMNMNMNMNMNPVLYQNFINIQNISVVNIFDCFDYNQKFEFFVGENAMYCNNCNKQLPASNQPFLYTIPEILIIVLNRGKGIEFKVKLEFYEDLNLEKYVQMKNTGHNFKLIGVVTHMGESGASGHFIAYCKSPIDKEWYRYNDDIVTPVKNFKQEIIDYAMPYILFYEKTDVMK